MKILVVYATAGAGHRKAAEAVFYGLKSSGEIDVTLADALDFTSRFYKQLYSGTYTFLITKIPWLWGLSFGFLDQPWMRVPMRILRRFYNSVNARGLARFLKEENFDYIFSTHFFPNEVAAYLKRKGLIRSQIISVVTDFDVHRIWLSEGVDLYTVATEWTGRKIQTLGVKESQVKVVGIPTHPKFAAAKDIRGLKQRLELNQDAFTVLVATGSFGIGPIEEIINRLSDVQVIVVCGHNKALFERLSRIKKDLVKICGLVDNMDELMAVSDVMVTKPGGLSISEALVTGLPLVFFSAIPGQETNNIKVLGEYGIGHKVSSVNEIAQIIHRFKSEPQRWQEARERIKAVAQPDAVGTIRGMVGD